MNKKMISGTPWHICFLEKKPMIFKRDKRKCAYYTKERCLRTFAKCFGSTHCKQYIESETIRKKYNELVSQPLTFPKRRITDCAYLKSGKSLLCTLKVKTLCLNPDKCEKFKSK